MQDNHLATIFKYQVFSTWDPWDKLFLEKALSSNKPPYSLQSKNANSSNKKAQKEKKKKQRCKDTEQAGTNSTPTTGVNASSTKTHLQRKNLSLITCYNCNKKGYYVDYCSKPKKIMSKN